MSRGKFTTPAPHSSILESADSAWLGQALEKHITAGGGNLARLGTSTLLPSALGPSQAGHSKRDKPAEYRSACRYLPKVSTLLVLLSVAEGCLG